MTGSFVACMCGTDAFRMVSLDWWGLYRVIMTKGCKGQPYVTLYIHYIRVQGLIFAHDDHVKSLLVRSLEASKHKHCLNSQQTQLKIAHAHSAESHVKHNEHKAERHVGVE